MIVIFEAMGTFDVVCGRIHFDSELCDPKLPK